MNVIKALRVFDYHTSEDKIHIFEEKDSYKILELLSSTYSGMEFSIDDVALIGDVRVESDAEVIAWRSKASRALQLGQEQINELQAEITALQKVNEELRSTLSDYGPTVGRLRDENEMLRDIKEKVLDSNRQLSTLVTSLRSDMQDMTYLDNLCPECQHRANRNANICPEHGTHGPEGCAPCNMPVTVLKLSKKKKGAK